MRTVVLGEPPAELRDLIERRRRLGQDRYDEVWEGTYVMAPAPAPRHAAVQTALVRLLDQHAQRAGLIDTGPFNLGGPDDFRVPDLGYHRTIGSSAYVPTAAIVVEVVSPDDETYQKFDFYAAHGVEDLIVADPQQRTVRIWTLRADRYDETGASDLLGVTAEEVARDLRWP